MAKYNKLDEPIRQAKIFNEITESMKIAEDRKLRTMNKQRLYNETRDMDLLEFGMSLYEHNYKLDDVRLDLELCKAMRDMNPEYDSDKSMVEYVGVSNVPSYKKMLTIVDNPALFMPIENGYNIAYRRAYAKKLDWDQGVPLVQNFHNILVSIAEDEKNGKSR